MKRVLLFFLLFLVGCGSSERGLGPYTIGRDPTWFPLNLKEMTTGLNGFTNAFVQELSKVEKRPFEVVDVNWNQLFEGLEKGDYGAIFSSLSPNLITTERYSFSDPFLLLGPVLVVPIESKARSLADLENTTVDGYQYDDSVLIIQKHPSILIETYQHITQGLEDVASGKVEGALVPNMEAKSLIPALYKDRLKIVTEPLSDNGLRIITLKGEQERVVAHFNAGFQKLKEDGTYQKLLKQFGVK